MLNPGPVARRAHPQLNPGLTLIGIVHGYGLGGAGSNLWTREVVSALCETGHTVHLMCQERTPEMFRFVAELWTYDDGGRPHRVLAQEPETPGRCIVHRPALAILPTYVRPDRPSEYVRSILDLDDDALTDYLERNVRALRQIVAASGVRAWHVNHAILLSEALRRVKESDGIAYAVMPHGSALEYVVRHDPRMQAMARRALASADHVFALGPEIRERLHRFFPDLDLEARTTTLRVGVDTGRFRPVPREARGDSIDRLTAALHDVARGHRPEHSARLRDALSRQIGAAEPTAERDPLRSALETPAPYETAHPDAEIEERLRQVHWQRENVVIFVGRIIPAKGVQALVAAFPLILERMPQTRLLLVGAGWLREYLEAFVLALSAADGARARRVLTWAAERAQEGARPSGTAFLQRLVDSGRFRGYVNAAHRHLEPERVIFTGYLAHSLLAHVFPLADAAVFPSAVAEASPLVLPEAAACGCFPMGTDFAGMRDSLDALAPHVPPVLRPLLRLDPDPARTADDIAHHVLALLQHRGDAGPALRDAAVAEYDWRRIAETLAEELARLT